MNAIPICIGYDEREAIAYHVLCHSIMVRSSLPVQFIPLVRRSLKSVYARPREPLDSTDFSNSRWVSPLLVGRTGHAIFMDCDMLCRGDIADLWSLRDERHEVMVRKHEHVPAQDRKFLDTEQTRYERKNWSSLMLMDVAACSRDLDPDTIHDAPALELHQFAWCKGEIGDLPRGWNLLVGYDDYDPAAKLVHFTSGGPWFAGYEFVDYADEWRAEALAAGFRQF